MSATTEADKYEVLDKIGHGSFGIIHKVRRKMDNKVLCRKEINYVRMSTKEREQLQAEINILSSLRHPNIVSYFHREHLKSTQDLHLYMEYCGGGDLSRVIKTLYAKNEFADEAYVWSIFAQLVTALYRCHYGVDAPEVGKNVMAAPKPMGLRQKNQVMILHRDLKPENVFLGEDDSVKLGDFGLSKSMQANDFASTYVGTPYYMSPEICAAEKYTLQSDIWSLGCIMYELCTGKPPFDAKTHFELVQKIKLGHYKPLPNLYSPELQGVIASCLKTNPQKRPDTATLLELPVVRLLRKEREVVELGKVLKGKEEAARRKMQEAETLIKTLESDKAKTRAELETVVRREWEVKARLEIDRQVQLEKERLMKQFETEFPKHVQAEVEKQLRSMQAAAAAAAAVTTARSHSPDSVPTDSVQTHDSETLVAAATDMSSLSLESPTRLPSLPGLGKRLTRTPFSRARTQYDSPMDVHMGSPSPVAIASLSLSPRRAMAAAGNLFAAAERRIRWQPHTLSPATSDDEGLNGGGDGDDDDDDGVPELPSPTRAPRAKDPFKARPGARRQGTVPVGRLAQPPPALFSRDTGAAKPTSPTCRVPQPTSPTRRGPLKPAKTGEDMLRAVVQRNAGRTLVELQQARAAVAAAPRDATDKAEAMAVHAAGDRKENDGEGGSRAAARLLEWPEVARWDPEKDEMPSPFLVRKTRGAALMGR